MTSRRDLRRNGDSEVDQDPDRNEMKLSHSYTNGNGSHRTTNANTAAGHDEYGKPRLPEQVEYITRHDTSTDRN
jgi:hypothetical protein